MNINDGDYIKNQDGKLYLVKIKLHPIRKN